MGKIRVLAILCAVLLVAPPPYSFAQQPQQQPIQQPASTGVLSPQQLDSLVAPLALYPDPILSQVLVASTYPLQIVEAERWLEQHSSLTGKPLADAAAKHPWDASVQALVMIPDVLKRLSQNISWTSNLGNAVLAQEDGVMQAIQRMRQKAQQNGALQSTPNRPSPPPPATVRAISPSSPPLRKWSMCRNTIRKRCGGLPLIPIPRCTIRPVWVSSPGEPALPLAQSGGEAGTTGDGTLDGEVTISSSTITSSIGITSTVPA
jgi:uncharacterized protein DUF3300